MSTKPKPLKGDLQEAAFVQARLLDQFIALARETVDTESGFTRESLNELLENLRDQRRSMGTAIRPRVVLPG